MIEIDIKALSILYLHLITHPIVLIFWLISFAILEPNEDNQG